MKQCPYCKAQIEENARFCLYCMTSLEEKQVVATPEQKKKGWLFATAVLLVLVILIGTVTWATRKDPLTQTGANGTVTPTGTEEVHRVVQPAAVSSQVSLPPAFAVSQMTGEAVSADSSVVGPIPAPIVSAGSTLSGSSSLLPVSSMPTSSVSTAVSSRDTGGQGIISAPVEGEVRVPISTVVSSAESSSMVVDPNSPETIYPSLPPGASIEISYMDYDAAVKQASVDPFVEFEVPENAIVIIRVYLTPDEANYALYAPCVDFVIPETIDGKPVVALSWDAFSYGASCFRSITVPATVKAIGGVAFSACHNLTDLYLCGKEYVFPTLAVPHTQDRTGTLTIHCAADCVNFEGVPYKDLVNEYYAKYEEWNG